MLAPTPTFVDFYRAIHRRAPFPWQERLARQVDENEEWPREVGVPTGLGKTACLDIAVWWLASQADRAPVLRTAPTRIWWVVNRRLLVDSTWEHAEHLCQVLANPVAAGLSGHDAEVVAGIAERLRHLSATSGASPLDVIRLRGGIAPQTPVDPSRPTVILCTLPMYGSRLLFRGYGSSLNRRPLDAAMAGSDSLVLLDEAHLARHLMRLLPALAECAPGVEPILGGARSSVSLTALTATGDPSVEHYLDEQDESHPTIRERLDSAKPLEVSTYKTGDPAKLLADAARELLKDAQHRASCLVFANAPKTARGAFKRLRRHLPDADVLLLTGLNREREAERIRARILDSATGMAATRDTGLTRERHLVVVATQTLEVGADIDAEYLVTEACGVRALTQRLGRLNRLGRYPHARAAYVHVTPSKRQARGGAGRDSAVWPPYGEEPAKVLQRLKEAGTGTERCVVDLSPARVAKVLGPPGDDPGPAPEVLPGILWEWTKTTSPPDGEAPVEPYFSGIAGTEYTVSLVWRAHVPDEGQRLWPRPSDREAVDVAIGDVQAALPADEVVHRLAPDGESVETAPAANIRPGDQLVLAADRLLDEFGWDPDASGPVVDASLDGQGLPLDATAIQRLCGVDVAHQLAIILGADEHDEVDQHERARAVEAIVTTIQEAATPPGWRDEEWAAFTGALRTSVEEPRREVPRLRVGTPEPDQLSDLGGDADETSLSSAAVLLDEHGQAVGTLARVIAERIGLRADMVEVVARAGALHDIGKADARFQERLDPTREHQGALLAKSTTPRHHWDATWGAWPRGGRHEDLSARLVEAWLRQHPDWGDPQRRELLLHLVISHHGKGRPLVLPVDDGTLLEVSVEVEGVHMKAPADLAVADWGQPRRFRELNVRFGPWGLALLEAIVRLADWEVSAGADRARETGR